VRFISAGCEYHTYGIVHEVEAIVEAVHQARLILESLAEPRVHHELITRRPGWSTRLGYPALVLLTAEKPIRLGRSSPK
jgi:hypothetical protein